MAKLLGLIEDLFEADDSLPDHDAIREMAPGQSLSGPAESFFEVVASVSGNGQGNASTVVLSNVMLQKLLKLVRQCSRPLPEISLGQALESGKKTDLRAIPQTDLSRLFSILERTARVADDLDPFPSQSRARNQDSNAHVKRKKKNKNGSGRTSASPSRSPEHDDAAEDEEMVDGDRVESNKDDQSAALNAEDTNQALESLSSRLDTAVRSILAAECCLATLTGDQLPKPLMSEDLIRTCFDAVKVSLDRILLPFIEGCSGASYLTIHPLLSTLIATLAPQKARKKKSKSVEEPAAGVGAICRDTMSRLFRHVCSALYAVQRLVRLPFVSLSDSIVISAVYFGQGPFFVNEPESGSGGGSNEAAKLAAAGRAALASLGGANAMKSLRTPALNLLRNIFAKHPDQRQWVIEEILTSLTKLTDMKKNRRHYSLRNGKSIHSITALLLQLVQAAAHGTQDHANAAIAAVAQRRQLRAQHGQSGLTTTGGTFGVDDEQDDVDNDAGGGDSDAEDEVNAEMTVWRRGLEGAQQSARSIALYLLQRSGQAKPSKSSQEMSYPLIIENLVQDLLNVLYLPDWPAAALLLSNLCRLFGTYLEDPKGNPDTKGIALDHLGTIAARLRQSQKAFMSKASMSGATTDSEATAYAEGISTRESSSTASLITNGYQSYDDLSILKALNTFDSASIKKISHAYRAILGYLARAGSDEQATEGSVEFVVAQVQGEFATAHSKVIILLDQAIERDAPSLEIAEIHHFQKSLEAMVRRFGSWSPPENEVFSAVTDDDFRNAVNLMERITISSSVMVSYEFMHSQLVEALDGQIVGNRSKALRGLGSISAVDPDLLDDVSVRTAVEIRLRDSSSSVREAAVGLFAKYVLRKPEHIEQYYEQLAGRIHDAGLAVRKRVLKLLESIHFASTSMRIRVDSCTRIIRCVNDDDKIVQELAVATIGKMWLSLDIAGGLNDRGAKAPKPAVSATVGERNDSAGAAAGEKDGTPDVDGRAGSSEGDQQPKGKLSDTIQIIMAVAGVIREKPSPLEEVFRRLHKDRKEEEAKLLLTKLQELSDSMIDSLVESSEGSTSDTVNRIKTVQLLVSTNPSILTINKAKLLLPYLRAAQTPEEIQIMELLLRIFRACLPWMPKTALAFAEALEKSLTPLVSRPPTMAGLQSLQELIACFCTVIVSHTHNYRILARTLRACFVRLQQMKTLASSGRKVEEMPSWSRLMSMTALLCEHANFDDIRSKNSELAADINAISPSSILDTVSDTLLTIYKFSESASKVRSVTLQNLGFLFRAYPSLMMRGPITEVMDEIFDKGTLPERTRLLVIILEFLNADSARRNPDALVAPSVARKKAEAAASGSVDMTVLVGNTESFADTGVGSAMMQRYADPVLKATLETTHPALQRTAIDILKFTVMQGLSHPIQCVPYLVALETTGDATLRNKALQLHSHLSSKHGSLVQARFLDSARAAFKFQLGQASAQTVRGFHMEAIANAMLNPWYSLLRDRRSTRLEFLRQIVKALDVNTAASECDQDDVLFARFIADNLATLDYKTLEELFIVIGELRSILAVSGMQILFMAQSQIKAKMTASGAAEPTVPESDDANAAGTGDMASPSSLSLAHLTGEWQLELASPSHGDGFSQSMAEIREEATTDATLGNEKLATVGAQTLARMSIISGTALLLRNHLKSLYNLSEAKCAKFNPGKKQSAGADRPAVQRNVPDPNMTALQFESMPLGLALVSNDEEAMQQMMAYAQLVESEGTMLEPEDPDMMDDLAL